MRFGCKPELGEGWGSLYHLFELKNSPMAASASAPIGWLSSNQLVYYQARYKCHVSDDTCNTWSVVTVVTYFVF